MLKLFYVTDIHGSNVCYRKFLNALPIYGVDVAVLNGDLLGKVLDPAGGEGRRRPGMPPHGSVHRDELRRRDGGHQEDHRERRLLLGRADS